MKPALLSSVVLTISMLSCADGTKQSPIGPSLSAANVQAAKTGEGEAIAAAELSKINSDDAAPGQTARPGTIPVTVTEKDKGGVSDITVNVTCGSFVKELNTKSNGKVTFPGVPAGRCLVTVSFKENDDYRKQQQWVTVRSGTAAPVSFTLTKKPKPPCDVYALLREYARCDKEYPGKDVDSLSKNIGCKVRADRWLHSGCKGPFVP